MEMNRKHAPEAVVVFETVAIVVALIGLMAVLLYPVASAAGYLA